MLSAAHDRLNRLSNVTVHAGTLESLPLPAGGIVTVPISDPSLLGRAFVVSSGQRIFVERSLPRGHDLDGRSGSFLLAG